MKELEIDIETKSDRDIKKCGVYAYADSPHFAVTLFSVSVDGDVVQLYDLTSGDVIPDEILNALVDESIIKRAFNVQFERVCLSKYLHMHYPEIFSGYSINEDTVHDYLNPRSWQCTMIHARYLGLPSSLAQVGEVLKLQQQKLTEGKALIKFFCVPYDYKNGVPLFHNPADYPEKWELFKKYNIRDVESELEIDRRLSKYPVPDNIWEEFYLDQEINDRGIAVDMEFVEAALMLDGQAKAKLSADMRRLTGIDWNGFTYTILPGADKIIYSKISDISISMKTTDYLKMPELISVAVPVYLNDKELEMYRKMEKEMVIPYNDGDITAANSAVLCGKLAQLASGCIYADNNDIVRIHDSKLDVLEDLIEAQNGKPVLIAYWYQHERFRIMERFDARELKTDKDIKEWNDGKIPIALIQPSSAGHGLNLQDGGSTMIWYTMPWSLELYQQTNARLWRQGQQAESVVIMHLTAVHTVDEDIMEVLEGKDKTQAAMMRAVKARIK